MVRNFSFRWRRFRCFQDTDWFRLRPITIVIGPNASGKTSLIAPLLLLKQTDEARDASTALKTKGGLFNAGGYRDIAFEHNTKETLHFSLQFRPTEDLKGYRKKKVGSEPPAILELIYDCESDGNSPRLRTFSVLDAFGRPMLKRERQASGRYSVEHINLPQASGIWKDAVEATKPAGFLFTPENVFSEFFRLRPEKQDGAPSTLEVGKLPQHYMQTVSYTAQEVASLLQSTYYIGPLRDRPRRFYELTGETPYSVGRGGTYAPEILFRKKDAEFQARIDEWVSRFEFGIGLRAQELAEGVFSLLLQRQKNLVPINLADTGFGLSQVLPLIVQGFYAAKGSVIVAEQPEIHLNPRLQGVMAELFVVMAQRGLGVLIETHSEHLLLRLRRLVAEEKIKHSDVAIYFCERDFGGVRIREIPIQSDGGVASADWPVGFFEDALADSFAMAEAQVRHKNDASRRSN
jgi:hypothetical protein